MNDEIEKLREALRKIAAMTDDTILEPEWVRVAREALGDGKDD